MKKVILSKQEPISFIFIDGISRHKYYGLSDRGDSKAFITATRFQGPPLVIARGNLTEGNGWSILDNQKTLKTCIENAINKGFEVYEFDTYQELFKWLIEK